jgi:glycosyltransferase involved in cell wall biosynthesis
MAKIIWQSEYKELIDAFQQKHLPNDSRGGFIYEYSAANFLATKHDLIMDKHSARGIKEGSIRYLFRLILNKIEGDVFIKSTSVINHGIINKSKINIGILHHIYLKGKKKSLKGRLSLIVLHKKLRALNYVVCVSKYWENYLKNIGCKNVKTIYNSFDLNEFVFRDDEIESFLKKHNIPTNKPLIYIGIANPQKGILEAYNALKNEDYTLVMTGPFNPEVDIPVKRLFLDRHDYLCLLKASDVVVSMPIIEEGWSRVAHESMLCRTPVIGTGTGGMKELLEGGKQIICNDFQNIPAVINEVIKQREKFVSNGYDFVKRFDTLLFQKEWNDLIQEVLTNTSNST